MQTTHRVPPCRDATRRLPREATRRVRACTTRWARPETTRRARASHDGCAPGVRIRSLTGAGAAAMLCAVRCAAAKPGTGSCGLPAALRPPDMTGRCGSRMRTRPTRATRACTALIHRPWPRRERPRPARRKRTQKKIKTDTSASSLARFLQQTMNDLRFQQVLDLAPPGSAQFRSLDLRRAKIRELWQSHLVELRKARKTRLVRGESESDDAAGPACLGTDRRGTALLTDPSETNGYPGRC